MERLDVDAGCAAVISSPLNETLDFFSESAGPADVCRIFHVSAAFVWYQKLQRMPGLVSTSAILPVPTAGQQYQCQAKFRAAQSFSLAIRDSVNDSTSENVSRFRNTKMFMFKSALELRRSPPPARKHR